ncbi:MAG: hypothetical protein LBH43_08370 [Treponema sp.]|jgi:hypothetical protein|nr:hypothetical protein [Treponema sp.]
MKKYFFLAFLLPVMLAVGVSCKSAPADKPAPPAESQPNQDGLNRSASRAEAARKQAGDFDCSSYFPSDWENAESRYNAARGQSKSTDAEIQEAAASYDTAADIYEEIFKKTIPLYAQAREDEIMSVRDELISTGLAKPFPDYLRKVDDMALAALDQYEAGDYYTAKDTAANALDEYEVLLIGAGTYLTREEIVERGFIKYDPENFDTADEMALWALEQFEAGNKKTAGDGAKEAGLRYNVILANSWIFYAADRQASASSERERALSNKVNIAVRDTFREAEASYYKAEVTLEDKKYESAAILFTEAEALFVVAGRDTEGKRRRAQDTIKLAEEMIEESDEAAIQAERLIGGSR